MDSTVTARHVTEEEEDERPMARSVCGICCILAVVVRNSLQLVSLSMTWYSSPWHTTPSMKTGAREAMAVSR